MKPMTKTPIRRRLMVAAVAAAVLSSLAVATPSQAVDAHARRALPIKAGTSLIFMGTNSGAFHSPDSTCTAGAVMFYNRFLYRIRPYDRAVRYVLTAKHCGSMNQMVRVGDVQVGKVTWVSPTSDLALVRIEPDHTRSTHCFSGSTGRHCSIVETYTPRAIGQVILAQNRGGQENTWPVRGSGAPGAGEKFCTTGQTTGVICDYQAAPTPARVMLQPNEVAAVTSSINNTVGDSGGPIVSPSGTIYGIEFAAFGAEQPLYSNYMFYIPIAHAMRELPGYALVLG
ncbi:trypsin-like serine protease [Clavibacter michiganensis]|uniref:trypsin-like serine protease n=1 Tax=Clavibacter michiganensis TaxID=28447 RepID=UPI0009BC3174|nr:trypsin-like serine protease [Clavibacter michiganensis]